LLFSEIVSDSLLHNDFLNHFIVFVANGNEVNPRFQISDMGLVKMQVVDAFSPYNLPGKVHYLDFHIVSDVLSFEFNGYLIARRIWENL
jgi:hypothetical protein